MSERFDRLREVVAEYYAQPVPSPSDELIDAEWVAALGAPGAEAVLELAMDAVPSYTDPWACTRESLADVATAWLMGAVAGARAASGEPGAIRPPDST